jgi:hypothetical protein
MFLKSQPLRAVAALAVLTILAVAVAAAFLLWDLRNRELAHARGETEALASMLVEQTEQGFESADLVLKVIQDRLQSGFGYQFPLDSLPVHLLLGARSSGMSQLASVFVVDSSGTVVNTSRMYPVEHLVVLDREYFKAFADGTVNSLFIGRPVRNRIDGTWTIHFARRLAHADGKFRGVVVAAFNLEHFERLYDSMKLDFERPISLHFGDGTLIASVPHRDDAIGTVSQSDAEQTATAGGVVTKDKIGANGEHLIVSTGQIPKYPSSSSPCTRKSSMPCAPCVPAPPAT